MGFLEAAEEEENGAPPRGRGGPLGSGIRAVRTEAALCQCQ